MACDKETCRTCKQIARFRYFKSLLPDSVKESFDEWFTEVYSDLEMAQMDLATAEVQWRQDQPRWSDETELRYQHRLQEWKEQEQNEHQRISNN